MNAPAHPVKDWMTAREFAALGLKGLPGTERGMQLLAKENGWDENPTYCRQRAGRGGGLEYHVSLLPTHLRKQYEEMTMVVGDVEPIRPQRVLPTPPTERAQRAQTARLAILTAWERYGSGLNLRESGRAFAFAGAYNMGHIRVDDWVLKEVPSISPRSLFRWRSEAKEGQQLGTDRSLARKGKGLLETANGGAIKWKILAHLAINPAYSAQDILDFIEDEFGSELTDAAGELKPLPPLRTFQHYLKTLRAEKNLALTKITNPDHYRSNKKLRGTGSFSWVTEPNQLWMIDASPVDALCIDGRYTIYAAIDVATRRICFTLSKTPRASAVLIMLRKALMLWGAPRTIKTDNGSDFKAKETQRFFAATDIDPDPSDAYCPDQKPYVERVIGTFQHQVGPKLPGYIGHSVAERKAIEERRSFADRLGSDETRSFSVSLTAAQLQQHIDDWVEYIYLRREHRMLKMSPLEAAARSTAPIRRIDERALDVLLMPVAGKDGRRKMTPQGIQVGEAFYITHSIMVGTEVFVRMDPIDMGTIYVFDLADGRYLGTATCPALVDVNRPEFVKHTKELYEAMVGADVKRIRKEKRELLKGPTGIERALRLYKRKAEAEQAGSNVVPLPRREETHTTPAIEAALEVFRPKDEPKPLSPRAAEIYAAAKAEQLTADVHATVFPAPPSSERVRPLRAVETREQRWRKWLQLEERRVAGNELSFAEANWMGSYQTDPEWRAMKRLHDDGATF